MATALKNQTKARGGGTPGGATPGGGTVIAALGGGTVNGGGSLDRSKRNLIKDMEKS